MKRHLVRGSNPQRAFAALQKISANKQAVWEAYHAGKITSAEMNRRLSLLETHRQAARDKTTHPHYKPGDVVVSKTGDRAVITGAQRTEWGSLQYSVTRGQERGERIHDVWPAEIIVRKASGVIALSARRKKAG